MHISLRIPDELVAELDAEALRERRSRNQVIVMRLERKSERKEREFLAAFEQAKFDAINLMEAKNENQSDRHARR